MQRYSGAVYAHLGIPSRTCDAKGVSGVPAQCLFGDRVVILLDDHPDQRVDLVLCERMSFRVWEQWQYIVVNPLSLSDFVRLGR